MYSVDRLNDLAADPSFVADVHSFVAAVLADGHLRTSEVRHTMSLADYGPHIPGVIIRLPSLLRQLTLTAPQAAIGVGLLRRLDIARASG